MVFSARPLIAADTATFVVPEPGAGAQGWLDSYVVVVPYSSLHSLTSKPLGLTLALSVALVGASELAASVLTVGLTGVLLLVLNSVSAPSELPRTFLATTRKW